MDDATGSPMQRVLVSGISGAGKTTLATQVAAALDLPYTELDALHHGAGWVKRPEFEDDAAALAAGERWITEDQYQTFIGDLLWDRADTVLWLDLPRRVVMWRVVTRTFGRMVLRTKLYNGNRERVRNLASSGHPIRWAWSQHADRRARTEAKAAEHPDVRVVRLRTTACVDRWLRSRGIVDALPTTRLRSRGRVGADYFERSGLHGGGSDAPRGLVDTVVAHRADDFDPDLVSADVVRFYERTADYVLDTTTRPAWWFRVPLGAFGVVARRIQQTDFPHGVPLGASTIVSRIDALHPHAQLPDGARSWVRTWRTDREPRVLYAALYAHHDHAGRRYLDISFPFPGGTLASVLRFVQLRDGGIELTTANADRVPRRDAGIWWLGRRLTLRLPMSESIRVWPSGAPGLSPAIASIPDATVVAEHRLRIFGLRFMTLFYVARPSPTG